MGWFKRDRPVPDWAPAFKTGKDSEHFKRLVIDDLHDRGFTVIIEGGVARIQGSGEFAGCQFGLTNPGQRCAARPRHEWPDIIFDHFTQIEGLMRQGREPIERWEQAADRVCFRLWDVEGGPTDLGDEVSREDVPGLRSVLMVDPGQSLRTVTHVELRRWGVDVGTAFSKAIENLPRLAPVDRVTPTPSPGTPSELVMLVGPSPCTASWLVAPAAVLPADMGAGVLVSAPLRDRLLACPISRANLLIALRSMVLATHGMFMGEPGGVSPRVYWWYQGRLEQLKYEKVHEGVKLTPHARFAEATLRLTKT